MKSHWCRMRGRRLRRYRLESLWACSHSMDMSERDSCDGTRWPCGHIGTHEQPAREPSDLALLTGAPDWAERSDGCSETLSPIRSRLTMRMRRIDRAK